MKPNIWIAALAFFSVLLFGGGVLLHHAPPAPVPGVSLEPGKLAAHGHHAKPKSAAKDTDPGTAAGSAAMGVSAAGNSALTFPLMLAGGAGLLLSAVLGLVSLSALERSQPVAARRLREAELALRKKQQGEFEVQQTALQSQLHEAKQRKAETEALRDQVSRQFQEFFRTLPVACFCFAANGRIIRWNAACEALYGIPAATALESTLWDTIVPATEREETEEKLSQVLSGESLLGAERWDMVAGGERARLRCSMVPLYDAEGIIIGGLSAGADITEFMLQHVQISALTAERNNAIQKAEIAAAALAEKSQESRLPAAPAEPHRQEITGHAELYVRLEEEINRSARYHSPMSLIRLDLDSFDARMEALGSDSQEQALQSVVTTIKSKLRTVDVLARLDAGEYAVILPETGEAGARVVADRLRTGLAGTSIGGQPPLTACLGVTQLTPEVSGADALVTRAQDALRGAKSCGPNTAMHYQDLPQDYQPKAPARAQARPRSAKKVEA